VLLGAADTFRAAAADQLETWGKRIGAEVVRSDREGADPASVAFEAVQAGIDQRIGCVIVDTGLNAGGQKEILFGVAAAR